MSFIKYLYNPKISKEILKWRETLPTGTIMKPSTFKQIEQHAKKQGYKDPKAVAGKAYWITLKAKYELFKKLNKLSLDKVKEIAKKLKVKITSGLSKEKIIHKILGSITKDKRRILRQYQLTNPIIETALGTALGVGGGMTLGYLGKELVKKIMEKKKKKNPKKKIVKIYDNILAIEAEKGKNSLFAGELFRHDFNKKGKAAIYGLPDGSLLIKGNKRLWKEFDYD